MGLFGRDNKPGPKHAATKDKWGQWQVNGESAPVHAAGGTARSSSPEPAVHSAGGLARTNAHEPESVEEAATEPGSVQIETLIEDGDDWESRVEEAVFSMEEEPVESYVDRFPPPPPPPEPLVGRQHEPEPDF